MTDKLKFGNTFCVLPWISDFQFMTGKKTLCCWSDIEVTDIKDIRHKIWSNIPVPNCQTCYIREKNNIISDRQRESAVWLQNKDIYEHFNTDIEPDEKIVFLDLRVSNKCNLACVMCNQNCSSLWAKELKIPIKENKVNVPNNVLDLKKIYLSGGEPLIIEEFLDFIDKLAIENNDIELVINTNLSRLPDSTLASLKKIKKTCLVVSIDAYGSVNEYHRYPLKWSKFFNNLNRAKNSGIRIDFNTVLDGISVFGLEKMILLQDYCSKWRIEVLSDPKWLMLNNLPKIYKTQAKKNLEALKQVRAYFSDVNFKNKINYACELLDREGDEDLFLQNIKILDTRRKINHSDYLGVNLSDK